MSPEEERSQRFKQYTIAMIIRSVCVLLAVVLTGPLQWLAIAGAVLLPYFAVVNANSPQAKQSKQPLAGEPHRKALSYDDERLTL